MSALISTPIPNYVDPPTRPPVPQVLSVIFTALVIVALVLRLYTKACITRSFGLDDVFVINGTVCAVATFIIGTVACNSYGWNRHAWDAPPTMLREGRKYTFIYDILFSQAACQIKLSLLWFSRRLIGVASGGIFRSSYASLIALLVIVGMCEILFIIVSFLECRPLKAAWDLLPDYHYTCINVPRFLLVTGIINTSTDFFCTITPTIIVMKLQLPFRRKIAIASVFLVGISVNIASALRIYYLQTADDTWDYFSSTITGTMEIGLGLLCVNAPALRPLLTRYTTYLKSYTRTRGSASAATKSLSTSRSGQIPESEKLAGGDFRTRQFSVIKGANSSGLKGSNGIEITRTVELDTLHQTSYPTSIEDQPDAEIASQDDIPLRR